LFYETAIPHHKIKGFEGVKDKMPESDKTIVFSYS